METTDRDVLRWLVPETPLTWLAAVLVVGNLLDALFTLTFLQLRVIYEANPLMSWVYDGSPLSFMVTKLACVQLGLLLLWLNRRVPAAQMAVTAGAAMYTLIVVYHLSILVVLPSMLRS
jgi:hypothetical protein